MTRPPYPDAPYHGNNRRGPFFEGWYFKQAGQDGAFAAIPGVFLGRDAETSEAFIQIIFSSPPVSRFVRYPIEAFSFAEEGFEVHIGPNVFSMYGVQLSMPEIGLEASLEYKGHIPLKTGFLSPTIMGPFAYIPGMQCRHGVLSLWHSATGEVCYGNRLLNFDGADGYIEKDWGSAFPDSWVWMQCGDSDVTLMCAIASIPLKLCHFTGVICVLRCGDHQYRFATYNGAHIRKLQCVSGSVSAQLEHHGLILSVEAQNSGFGHLQAPTHTGMNRQIQESLSARFSIRLQCGGAVLMDGAYTGGLEMLSPEGLKFK